MPIGRAISSSRSCPVPCSSFPATTAKERVSFHLLNRETGNRLRRKLVDPETDEPVESDDQVKGYQVGKNEYVLVEEEEFEKVAIESSHTIDIETFVPRKEIDEAYLDTPYYLTPDGKMAEEAFAVIREAMREKGVVRHRPRRALSARAADPARAARQGPRRDDAALRLRGPVGRRITSRISASPRSPDEMLDLATHIIGRKLAHFEPKRFEDRYQDALLDDHRRQAPQPAGEDRRPPRRSPATSSASWTRCERASRPTKGGRTSRAARKTEAKPTKSNGKKAEPKAQEAEDKPPAKKPASTARRTVASKPARLKRAS